MTGILFLIATGRLVLRLAFAYRRPAEVTVRAATIRIRSRAVVLGRTVREREVVLARPGLVRAVREVRYSRLAFYAGLLALALGSLVGVHTFVDGVRAASPSLLFFGSLIVATGVGVDFALASLLPGRKGRCRVLFVPRDGKAVCVGDVEGADADAAFEVIAGGPAAQ